MKKTALAIFAALAAMLATPLYAAAQSTQSPQSPQSPLAPRVETNHSLSTGLLGAHYAWEFPIGHTATVVVRPGVQLGVTRMEGFHYGKETYHALVPVLDIEPRVYYNRDNRAARHKKMGGNQGNFLSVQIKTVPPFCIVSDIYEPRVVGMTAISPMWGMRRVWGGHWMFELSGGLSLRIAWNGEWVRFPPNLNARFGYSF